MAKKTVQRKTSKKADTVTQRPEKSAETRNPRVSKKFAITALIVLTILVLLFIFKSLFVAAIVNGQPISRLAVVKELEKQGGKRTLDSIITKALVNQEAKKKNISVSQKDVDAQLKTIETNLSKQGISLDQALKEQGLTKKDLVEDIKLQLLVQKMVGQVDVSQKEIDDYITTNQAQIPENSNPDEIKKQAQQQIAQQKTQEKIQELIENLKSKAKITYFVKY